MRFDPPLSRAVLVRRYKRFLADVRLTDGSQITVHCPNTGAMTGCAEPGSPCWYSLSNNAKRKYPGTLELVATASGHLAGINTGRANALVEEALRNGVIQELAGATAIRREARYGAENSRADFLLEYGQQQCFVEVKSVTLCDATNTGFFPDAVSTRGARHLRELAAMAREGHRAVLLYCVQHTGVARVRPAAHIDPAYTQALTDAVAAGVEVLAYAVQLSPEAARVKAPLPVCHSVSEAHTLKT